MSEGGDVTFMVRPPCMVSSYSSPSLKVFDDLDASVLTSIVQDPSAKDISIVGEEAVSIFLGTHGIPFERELVVSSRIQYEYKFEPGQQLTNGSVEFIQVFIVGIDELSLENSHVDTSSAIRRSAPNKKNCEQVMSNAWVQHPNT